MANYILKNENAIYYECGFSCDNVIFLNFGSEKFFITDARYTVEANEFISTAQVIQSSDLIKTAKELIRKSKIKKITFDPNDFSYADFKRLSKNLKIKFNEKPNFSKLKRMIKTDDEIQILAVAAQLGRDGFERFAQYIRKKEYICEKRLHFKMLEAMTNLGEFEVSFDPIVAINENAAKPHALPTTKSLEKNDILLVDAGVKYQRYCSDRTCVANVNFKDISFDREQKFKKKKYQKIYDLVYKAQLNAIENARTGMKASEIDRLTRSVIEDAGYGEYFVHSTGHGVGLDIHEFPNINSRNDVIIEDNMVFTIEPGIYLPNEFGVRIEDTVVMKEGKAIIL